MAHILAVDDESMVLDAIVASLENHEVTRALSADEGVRMAKASPPDLIIVDLHMPGKGGMALVREVRGIPALKHTPIVILTGDGGMAEIEQSFGFGANDYLIKPIPPARLRGRVDALLARPRTVTGTGGH